MSDPDRASESRGLRLKTSSLPPTATLLGAPAEPPPLSRPHDFSPPLHRLAPFPLPLGSQPRRRRAWLATSCRLVTRTDRRSVRAPSTHAAPPFMALFFADKLCHSAPMPKWNLRARRRRLGAISPACPLASAPPALPTHSSPASTSLASTACLLGLRDDIQATASISDDQSLRRTS